MRYNSPYESLKSNLKPIISSNINHMCRLINSNLYNLSSLGLLQVLGMSPRLEGEVLNKGWVFVIGKGRGPVWVGAFVQLFSLSLQLVGVSAIFSRFIY